MKISNKLTDKERHYLNNLIVSGLGQLPDNVEERTTHKLVVEKGFIVGAVKIIKRPVDKK